MARYWVYLDNGVKGPYELDQLIRLRGFSRQTRVSIEGPTGEAGEWMSPADIPSLAPIFKAADEINTPEPAAAAPRAAPKANHSPAPKPAARPRMSKARSGQWAKTLGIVAIIAALLVGIVLLILHQQGAVKQDLETAQKLVFNVSLPDNQFPTLGRYLEEKHIKPRVETEKVTDGVYHVTLSWFGEESRRSNVYAFEANVAVLSVRGLNTAASRLLSEGLKKPSAPAPVAAAAPAKKKSPTPSETFDDAVAARSQAIENGDFDTVWDSFSRRKRSEMIQAGMSREGFVRLQGLTHKLESGLSQKILKSITESDKQRLVLIRESHPPHGEFFLKQRWLYEEGGWKLDNEEKRAPDSAPAAPVNTSASEPETSSRAKPAIPVKSLPGVSN
jgi:hypothetical protein